MTRPTGPSARVVLLGDSHLARVRRDLSMVGSRVRNAAVGGATSLDLLAQAVRAAVDEHDVVVVSVGTNDAAPHHHVPVAAFAEALAQCLHSVPARRRVYVAPPGVDESRTSATGGRTNALIDAYREAAVAACDELGAHVVRTEQVIRPLGADAFVSDGLHLAGPA
jgi:lysophospholipase L1-like esterase